jgi:hypothetical protein
LIKNGCLFLVGLLRWFRFKLAKKG